ncbi:hypothetical protein Q4519_21215 [Motilimonas sp. 1_MG-2023]|nr:hypothetical protein [Motilimonas sp. 1_MG-2023]
MVYIWRNPNVPEVMVGELTNNFYFGIFQNTKEVDDDVMPIFRFNCKLKKLRKFCELANNKRVPLVNEKICNLLAECSNNIQFVKAKVQCEDDSTEDYYVVNVLSFVDALDKSKSIFDFVPGTKKIMRFKKIKYNEGDYIIAREINYGVHLLVNDSLTEILKMHGCKGLCLPEECI